LVATQSQALLLFLSPEPHVRMSLPVLEEVRGMDQFLIFLSAVSSEFGTVRDALANYLQSHDLIVRV
jgi:hypothetical protein